MHSVTKWRLSDTLTTYTVTMRPVSEKEQCCAQTHSIHSPKQVPLAPICMYICEDLPRMATFALYVVFSSANSDYP